MDRSKQARMQELVERLNKAAKAIIRTQKRS